MTRSAGARAPSRSQSRIRETRFNGRRSYGDKSLAIGGWNIAPLPNVPLSRESSTSPRRSRGRGGRTAIKIAIIYYLAFVWLVYLLARRGGARQLKRALSRVFTPGARTFIVGIQSRFLSSLSQAGDKLSRRVGAGRSSNPRRTRRSPGCWNHWENAGAQRNETFGIWYLLAIQLL